VCGGKQRFERCRNWSSRRRVERGEILGAWFMRAVFCIVIRFASRSRLRLHQGARTQAQAIPAQSTFQGCLDRLAIANPCYERGVAYINATAATLLHRLTRLIPLKPEVRSIVVSTSAFESEGHWFEPTLESVGVLASLVFVSPFLPIWAKKNGP
jgi:hypothetical protein